MYGPLGMHMPATFPCTVRILEDFDRHHISSLCHGGFDCCNGRIMDYFQGGIDPWE